MSVLDKETVDGIALDRDGNGIRLLITDHLDWSNEHNHLFILQEKINSYIAFCEGHQYDQVYKNAIVEYAIFEIHFMFEPTAKAMNFLEQVQRQVNEMGIAIECHVTEVKNNVIDKWAHELNHTIIQHVHDYLALKRVDDVLASRNRGSKGRNGVLEDIDFSLPFY